MSEKLFCRRISKGKSQSVYIVAHLKANLKVHKMLLIWITNLQGNNDENKSVS